jgi:hypothetical protein
MSNKTVGEDRSEGKCEIFMFIKRGHGLRKLVKCWTIGVSLHELTVTAFYLASHTVKFS